MRLGTALWAMGGALLVVFLVGVHVGGIVLRPRVQARGAAERTLFAVVDDGGRRDTDDAVSEYASANEALATRVIASQRRLEQLDAERAALQAELAALRQKLRAFEGDASEGANKNSFDLDAKDWAQLAKDGTVKYRTPCMLSQPWTPGPDTLQELGLAPADGPAIHDAYAASNERLWTEIAPLCARVAGSEAVANAVGLNTCVHLILDLSRDKDRGAADEAMRQVGEIRAGQRPSPGARDNVDPVVATFLTLTKESGRFEADLASKFGREEAHRLAFADGMCATHAEFGGSGPRP